MEPTPTASSKSRLLFCVLSPLLLISSLTPSTAAESTLVEAEGEKTPVESVVVETANGKLRGFRYVLPVNGNATKDAITSADIFLSVPFAQPPVGELRMEVGLFYTPYILVAKLQRIFRSHYQ